MTIQVVGQGRSVEVATWDVGLATRRSDVHPALDHLMIQQVQASSGSVDSEIGESYRAPSSP